jgi:hypothetical protein
MMAYAAAGTTLINSLHLGPCGDLLWLQVQRLCSAIVSSKPPAGKEFDLQQEQVFFVKVSHHACWFI